MYAAIIQGIMQAIGTGVAANQMQKARGGYEAQMSKQEMVEPIRDPNPKMFDWQSAFQSVLGANRNTREQRYDEARKQNAFNTAEAKRMYRSMQPYFDSLQAQQGKNALSFAQGELPQDVVANIGRAAAQRGIQGGYAMGAGSGAPGSALSNLNLRQLGLTSLDLSKYGTQLSMDVNSLAQRLSPQLANPEAQMLSLAQGMGYMNENTNRLNESNRYWNTLQNQAEWDNVSTLNFANKAIADANLASRAAEAKMWQEMGNSSGQSGSSAMSGGMSMFGGGGGGGGTGGMA